MWMPETCSEIIDRRPRRPPTTRSVRHNLPAAARPASRFDARALFVRHSDHGEAAYAGKGGGREAGRHREGVTARRRVGCCGEGVSASRSALSGDSACRRRPVVASFVPPSRIARPPFHALTPRFPFPPPREGSGRAAHAPEAQGDEARQVSGEDPRRRGDQDEIPRRGQTAKGRALGGVHEPRRARRHARCHRDRPNLRQARQGEDPPRQGPRQARGRRDGSHARGALAPAVSRRPRRRRDQPRPRGAQERPEERRENQRTPREPPREEM